MSNNLDREKHRRRVFAMRVAMNLAQFDPRRFITSKATSLTLRESTLVCPNPSEWSFIDIDPLLIDSDEKYFLLDNKYTAVWPIDITLAFPFGESAADFRIFHSRTVSPKDVRGLATRLSPKMATVQSIDFADGIFSFGGDIISMLSGKWVPAVASKLFNQRNGPIDRVEREYKDDYSAMMSIAVGAALRHRYEWSAIFDFPTGIRLRFGTDAGGALAIFKDRERPPEGRRSPLLHWVARHWRRTSRTVTPITTHLRGVQRFEWWGLPVTIIPAQYEIERAAC